MDLYEKNRKALKRFKAWLKRKQDEEEYKEELMELEADEDVEHLIETELEDYIV